MTKVPAQQLLWIKAARRRVAALSANKPAMGEV